MPLNLVIYSEGFEFVFLSIGFFKQFLGFSYIAQSHWSRCFVHLVEVKDIAAL